MLNAEFFTKAFTFIIGVNVALMTGNMLPIIGWIGTIIILLGLWLITPHSLREYNIMSVLAATIGLLVSLWTYWS